MHRRRGEHAAFVNRPEGPLQSLFFCQKPGFPNEEIPVFCRILLRAFLPPGRGPFHYRQEDASDAPHWQPPHDPLREQPPGQPIHRVPPPPGGAAAAPVHPAQGVQRLLPPDGPFRTGHLHRQESQVRGLPAGKGLRYRQSRQEKEMIFVPAWIRRHVFLSAFIYWHRDF